MDWMEQVKAKQKRHNQILFDRNSVLLLPLRHQIAKQSHIVIVAWCLSCLETLVQELSAQLPEEQRARQALDICRRWARGEEKMPQAKAAILSVHAIAKEQQDPIICALAHAIGQGLGSIHVETHAIGMVLYDLSAQVYALGIEHCREGVEQRLHWYEERLTDWSGQEGLRTQPWAAFLQKERPNKEALLLKREE